jgi:hypothetical protein
MPKTYIDEDGKEVELQTPEEIQADIDAKVAAAIEAQKKEEPKKEEKKDDDDDVLSLEDTNKLLNDLKKTVEEERKQKLDEWFDETLSPVIEDDEEKEKVRQYFDLLKTNGKSDKDALADALLLTTKKNINPFNGVTKYNGNSGIPKSEVKADEITEKFNSLMPKGWSAEKKA